MPLSMQLLQIDWTEPAGWSLMLAGLALGLWTLGEDSGPRRRPALVRPALGGGEPSHARRIDPAGQWQRLVAIAEAGVTRAEALGAAHARAVEAIEAADAAVTRLVADCAAAFMPAEAGAIPGDGAPDRRPAPAPQPQALAA